MKQVKNIIFDLGGVLINLNYQLTENAFVELGVTNFNDLYSQAQQTAIFDDFEKGVISNIDFYNTIRSISKLNLTDLQIATAWNAMLLDFPKHRLELLGAVKNNFNTFLLSNTNNIHINAFSNQLEQNFGFDNFSKLFVKTYYSSQIGLRKPNKEIFEFVLDENSLNAHETIFIDDSIQHVEGAKLAGLNAFLLEKNKDVSVLLKELNLI